MKLTSLIILAGLFGQPTSPPPRLPASPPPRVATGLTTYGAIAREIVGDRGTITSIAQGDEDPHFVQPKPSFVAVLRDADLFVTTGMDLELWVPALLDRAGNRKIMENAPGYVPAFRGIDLLDGIIIARNILDGLQRVSPDNATYFAGREKDFENRVLEATMGAKLVTVLT